MKKSSIRIALAGAVLCVPFASSTAAQEDIDFDALGRAFIEAHCGAEATTAGCGMQRILEDHYAKIRLGAFELNYPAAFLGEKHQPQDFTAIALGLLDLQRVWIEWQVAGGEAGPKVLAELDLLGAWVADWSAKELAALAKEPAELALFEVLAAPEEVRSAEATLYAFLHDPNALGLPMLPDQTVQIALSPNRRDFMHWVGYAGLSDTRNRNVFWVPGSWEWTQFFSGDTLIAALEYSPWTGFDPEFKTGKSMKDIEETGQVEQVSLQAAMALLRASVGRELGHVDNAIAMNLVIESVGQLNTIDGEGQIGTSGATTAPYERFVPGGNPNGGTLPAIPASPLDGLKKNQWRKDGGRGHFLAALKKGQKEGAKQARKEKTERYRDKLANFLLRADRGKFVVSAPFLGLHAAEQVYPPTEFLVDYREFFRAYKSAFLYWLQTRGVPDSEEASRAKYGELIAGLDEVDLKERTFELAFAEVYGLPLSASDGETDSLEWRFLKFVQKGK